MHISKVIMAVSIFAAVSFAAAGCERQGPAEEAGERLDRAVDEVQGAAEDLRDELDAAGDDVADKVDEGLDEAEDAINEIDEEI